MGCTGGEYSSWISKELRYREEKGGDRKILEGKVQGEKGGYVEPLEDRDGGEKKNERKDLDLTGEWGLGWRRGG